MDAVMMMKIVTPIIEAIGRRVARQTAEVAEIPRELSNLRREFDSLKGFLGDAEERQEGDSVVRKWMRDVRELAYEAQEITEKHSDRITRHRAQLQPGCWNALIRHPRDLFDGLAIARESSQIRRLSHRISKMTRQMRAYGIECRQAAAGDQSTDDDPAAATSEDEREHPITGLIASEDERMVVGLDEDIKAIGEQLISAGSTAKVVSICGVDGLGKTTLAMKVIKSKRVVDHFDAIAWAYVGPVGPEGPVGPAGPEGPVGPDFRVPDVLRNILSQLTAPEDIDNNDTNNDIDHNINTNDINDGNEISHMGEDVLNARISGIFFFLIKRISEIFVFFIKRISGILVKDNNDTNEINEDNENNDNINNTHEINDDTNENNDGINDDNGDGNGEGEDVLSARISGILVKKRCLVVLDDFQAPADGFRAAFAAWLQSTASSSKLVLTTPDPALLSYVDPRGSHHHLRFLNPKERWELFLKTAGSSGKGLGGFMLKLMKMRVITNHYVGLPLTIHLLGGLWKCNSSTLVATEFIPALFTLLISHTFPTPPFYQKEKDSKFHTDFGGAHRRSGDENNMSAVEMEAENVLLWVDDMLKSRLRLCLLDMVEYPAGLAILTEDLFSKWIDKGIIKPKNPRSAAEKVAQKCLDKLVAKSLVQVDMDGQKIKSCQLHRVVRDFYIKLKPQPSKPLFRFATYLKKLSDGPTTKGPALVSL